MKKNPYRLLRNGCLVAAAFLFTGCGFLHAQGTITFGGHVDPHGLNYCELGMWFRVIVQPGDYDSMGIIPPDKYNNLAVCSTPYLDFFRQLNPTGYVAFSLTDGSTFGLTSVDLADPASPSMAALHITFKGFKSDGSTISQTFTTPGDNATTLLPYTFNAVFASGLTSVEIDATRWAMDNLVFTVPEPNCVVLLGIGLSALVLRKKSSH